MSFFSFFEIFEGLPEWPPRGENFQNIFFWSIWIGFNFLRSIFQNFNGLWGSYASKTLIFKPKIPLVAEKVVVYKIPTGAETNKKFFLTYKTPVITYNQN